jgi:hypothetical protein
MMYALEKDAPNYYRKGLSTMAMNTVLQSARG